MNKFLMLLLASLLSSTLFAYSDTDLDGVADSIDKCPNTPFNDLVNSYGCKISKVKLKVKKKTKWHADVIIGTSYSGSKSSNTYSTSLQTDYYYENFSLQASTSYYKTVAKGYSNSDGLNDSFIGAAYNLHFAKHFTLRLGTGALLPTYKSSSSTNNTDYTGSSTLSYNLSKFNFFGGYTYTFINDTSSSYSYQNTNAYTLGTGYYFTNNLYISGAYNQSNSVYKGDTDIKTASLYAYYAINTNYFLSSSYSHGFTSSASDNALSLQVGYYF